MLTAGDTLSRLSPVDESVADLGGVETDYTASCFNHDLCGAEFLLKYNTSSLILPTLVSSPNFVQLLFSGTGEVLLTVGGLVVLTMLMTRWWLLKKKTRMQML